LPHIFGQSIPRSFTQYLLPVSAGVELTDEEVLRFWKYCLFCFRLSTTACFSEGQGGPRTRNCPWIRGYMEGVPRSPSLSWLVLITSTDSEFILDLFSPLVF
jgi:hypothetical protein